MWRQGKKLVEAQTKALDCSCATRSLAVKNYHPWFELIS